MIEPMVQRQPHAPIAATTHEERARLREQALRYRILYKQWAGDVSERIRRDVGSARAEQWGYPDMSANLLNAATSSVAVLYDREPKVTGRTKAATAVMVALLADAGYAELMQRVQRDTLGIREMLVRAEIYKDNDLRRLRLRPVWPHTVKVVCDDYDPTRILRVEWWRWRDDRWTRDVTDISDPDAPRYFVDDGAGTDLSPQYLRDENGVAPRGGYVGDSYPYRGPDGEPLQPFVLYHAAETGKLWDFDTLGEVVEATLNVSAAWTYWHHVLQSASWPQRYVVGLDVAGAHNGDDGSARQEDRYIDPDPTLILRFISGEGMDQAGMQPMPPGQFETTADLEKIGQSIQAYERRALAYAGLTAAEIMRSSGDPKSGYALAVNRDGQRESQRKYGPIFQRYDERLVRLVAKLYGSLPVTGWIVEHEMLPPSAAELREEREHILALIDAGLMSRVEGYMRLHPALDETEARRRLAELDAEREPAAPPSTPDPPPVVADDDDEEVEDGERRDDD